MSGTCYLSRIANSFHELFGPAVQFLFSRQKTNTNGPPVIVSYLFHYIQIVMPLVESISITFVFITLLQSFIAKLLFGLIMFGTVFFVYHTNAKRHCNNIYKRSTEIKNNLLGLKNKVFTDTKQLKIAHIVALLMLGFTLCSAASFSIFAYQSYCYAVVIFLKKISFTNISQVMPILTWLIILPASVFTIFAHWSDMYSTYRRGQRFFEEVDNTANQKVLQLFVASVCMYLNFSFAQINYKSALSKHLHYLAMYPDTHFLLRQSPILGFFVSFMMQANELLKGFNFLMFLKDYEILVFKEDLQFNINKLIGFFTDKNNWTFSLAAATTAMWKGYNVSKTASSFSYFVPSALPFFWNNLADNRAKPTIVNGDGRRERIYSDLNDDDKEPVDQILGGMSK